MLTRPIKSLNIPGVVIIDGERIEFFMVNPNVPVTATAVIGNFTLTNVSNVADLYVGMRLDGLSGVHPDARISSIGPNTVTLTNPMTESAFLNSYTFRDVSNKLTQLRRSTLGTAPSFFSDIGTKVIDQSIEQTIPFSETIYNQYHFTTATTDSYTFAISTSSTSTMIALNTGSVLFSDGIRLSTSTAINAVDQVQIFYGGRLLRKSGYFKHDMTVAYDSPDTKGFEIKSTSTVADLPYAFEIGTAYTVTSTNQVWVYTGSLEADAHNGYVYRGMDYVPPEFTIKLSTTASNITTSTSTTIHTDMLYIGEKFFADLSVLEQVKFENTATVVSRQASAYTVVYCDDELTTGEIIFNEASFAFTAGTNASTVTTTSTAISIDGDFTRSTTTTTATTLSTVTTNINVVGSSTVGYSVFKDSNGFTSLTFTNLNSAPNTTTISTATTVSTATTNVTVTTSSITSTVITSTTSSVSLGTPITTSTTFNAITTSTSIVNAALSGYQHLTLNIEGGISRDIKVQVVKKETATVWNNIDPSDSRRTLSIIDSTTDPAKFLQDEPSELPDKYYYGGNLTLTTAGGSPLTDIYNNPLEGF